MVTKTHSHTHTHTHTHTHPDCRRVVVFFGLIVNWIVIHYPRSVKKPPLSRLSHYLSILSDALLVSWKTSQPCDRCVKTGCMSVCVCVFVPCDAGSCCYGWYAAVNLCHTAFLSPLSNSRLFFSVFSVRVGARRGEYGQYGLRGCRCKSFFF